MCMLPASQHGNSLRRAAGELSGSLLRMRGKDWVEEAGIDPSRAKAWAGGNDPDSQRKQLPRPRELFLLAYLAGVEPGAAAVILEGRWYGEAMPVPEHAYEGYEARLDRVNRNSGFADVKLKTKGYRDEGPLEEALRLYSDRLGSVETASRVLEEILGLNDIRDAIRGDVALPVHSDAALARLLGRSLSMHWGLRRVVIDKDYMDRLDEAHRAIGDEDADLIEMSVKSLGVLNVGDPMTDGQDFAFCPLPEDGPKATVRDLVRPAYLNRCFVVDGADNKKILFHFRERRVESEEAAEEVKGSTLSYYVRMAVAKDDLDPVTRPVAIYEEFMAETIEGLLLKIATWEHLRESVESRVLGVKIPIYQAETMALALGVRVEKARKTGTRRAASL